ncbi:MAG: HAMP domain-containing sensor histidine kinase [Methanomicrobiaceae archaeon]|nr:HAMP domain-containing sensor histidine kinase [Methanomicrobiaceae archaeon]
MPQNGGTDRQQPFRHQVIIAAILIAVLFISLFSFFSYTEARSDLLAKEHTLKDQTEQHISQSVELIDKGLRLFDATFDHQLESLFTDFLAAYEMSGRDPGAMDLAALKEEINRKSGIEGEIELSIINETGIIEFNTFALDIGLDFKQWPEAWALLNQIRIGGEYAADRSVGGAANVLRKFAYMPTPDHRYILELGLSSESFHEKRKEFSYSEVAANFEKNVDDVLSVRFFDREGNYMYGSSYSRFGGGDPDYVPGPSVQETVSRVYEKRGSEEIADEENATLSHYFYIDLYSDQYVSGPEMSLVAQVVYSTAELDAALSDLLSSHLLIAVLAIFTGIVFAFFTSYFVSRPITEIIEDVERIAGGDLDHQIGSGGGTEFARLRQSINTMVATLKQNIAQIRKSEAKIKCYSENLEEMVNRRTETLRRESGGIRIYRDVISQDLMQTVGVNIALLSRLAQRLPAGDRHIAEEALAEARGIERTVRNTVILMRVQEANLPLRSTDLDAEIRDAIREAGKLYPDVGVHYAGTGALVTADEMAHEVIATLIENSRKLGGPNVDITLSVDEREDWVEVSFEDDASEMTDSMKEALSGEQDHAIRQLYAESLGLHVVRSLVRRYGGKIQAEEREGGGILIRITLKRA